MFCISPWRVCKEINGTFHDEDRQIYGIKTYCDCSNTRNMILNSLCRLTLASAVLFSSWRESFTFFV